MSEINRVWFGDARKVLEDFPDEFFDAVVTDPPYGYGFMGKAWDHGVPGVLYWEEALRVAKPGAHMLAFGGTRTHHRLMVAIEDAGWEIRDCLMWVYGCLSEDTEILTIDGWARYNKSIDNHPVLCYNIDNDSFEFHRPKRSVVYENKHTAYHIHSDSTDQIVSRNHRVLIERGGRKVFAYAETLKREETIPILESLHDLPELIPCGNEGTGIKKQDLLESVCRQEYWDTQQREQATRTMFRESPDNMCCVWESGVAQQGVDKKGKDSYMQLPLQRSIASCGVKKTQPQGSGWVDRGKHEELPRKDDRREQSRMERWSNLLQDAWKLCGREIRSVSRRILGYGSERRVCYGTPAYCGAVNGEMSSSVRGGASRQPRSIGQQPGKSTVVQNKPSTQAVRGTRATVTPIEYGGKVWCVEVETGAFVARRNGKIFITGNSGFPKSHDVSKAIDKAAGVEREREVCGGLGSAHSFADDKWTQDNQGLRIVDTPITDAAKQWDGWGTALKPAWEPIILARKPFPGTVADNVQKHRTGAINVDGCRVALNGEHPRGSGNPCKNAPREAIQPGRNGGNGGNETSDLGRFPANLIHDGSDEVVELFPQSRGQQGDVRGTEPSRTGGDNTNCYGEYGRIATPKRNDSGSAARFFYCSKASKADRNEGLDNTCTVKYVIGTPLQKGGMSCRDVHMALVESLQKATSESMVKWLTGESGESIMGLCQQDSLSTTLTEISKITTSQILRSLTPSLISAFTQDVNLEKANGGSLAVNVEKPSELNLITTNAKAESAHGASGAV
ncbi:MAG: hypothetical protein PHQ43_01195, partial [Dehalococcoidales bacterium]|nr:hypothetical protein [Dehalococcoidales bacterium]